MHGLLISFSFAIWRIEKRKQTFGSGLKTISIAMWLMSSQRWTISYLSIIFQITVNINFQYTKSVLFSQQATCSAYNRESQRNWQQQKLIRKLFRLATEMFRVQTCGYDWSGNKVCMLVIYSIFMLRMLENFATDACNLHSFKNRKKKWYNNFSIIHFCQTFATYVSFMPTHQNRRP